MSREVSKAAMSTPLFLSLFPFSAPCLPFLTYPSSLSISSLLSLSLFSSPLAILLSLSSSPFLPIFLSLSPSLPLPSTFLSSSLISYIRNKGDAAHADEKTEDPKKEEFSTLKHFSEKYHGCSILVRLKIEFVDWVSGWVGIKKIQNRLRRWRAR